MGLTFYYTPMTSATRVFWALEELGVPCEKVKVNLQAGEQRKPEYLKLNPNGKVPLLVVDGKPIFESLAQIIYLGETYGVDKGLYPPPGVERAEALKWMVWSSVTMGEALSRVMRNTHERYPADERNAHAAESAKKEIANLIRILDEQLAGKQYVLGSNFSFADLSLAGAVGFSLRLGIDTSSFANVTAWTARCMGRPAAARAMQG
jgi:glutathione S-transferase